MRGRKRLRKKKAINWAGRDRSDPVDLLYIDMSRAYARSTPRRLMINPLVFDLLERLS